MTLRFVVLIATPLCLVNSLIFSFGSGNTLMDWLNRFLLNYAFSFPQAVLYVTLIKRYDRKKELKKKSD